MSFRFASLTARRAFSVSRFAKAETTVKPPVQLFGVDGTYASALYTASAKTTSVSAATKSLNSISALLEKDTKLSSILSNPALSFDDRKVIVDTLVSQIKPDNSVKNLLGVLAENNRLGLLPAIAKQFAVLIDADSGVLEISVTSATPLDKKSLSRIQAAVSKSKSIGDYKSYKIKNTVNPEILGGLIVEVADKTVDLSVASKVAKLNQLLEESV